MRESKQSTRFSESKKEQGKAAVEIVRHDDFPEVLKVPEVKPKVLIEDEFSLLDPLSIWCRFISEEDWPYVALQTHANAYFSTGTKRKARRYTPG